MRCVPVLPHRLPLLVHFQHVLAEDRGVLGSNADHGEQRPHSAPDGQDSATDSQRPSFLPLLPNRTNRERPTCPQPSTQGTGLPGSALIASHQGHRGLSLYHCDTCHTPACLCLCQVQVAVADPLVEQTPNKCLCWFSCERFCSFLQVPRSPMQCDWDLGSPSQTVVAAVMDGHAPMGTNSIEQTLGRGNVGLVCLRRRAKRPQRCLHSS